MENIVLETTNSRPQDMHVNGDILARLVEHKGAETLRQLINEAAIRDDRVGEWMREHLESELAAVDEMIELLIPLLDRWI